MGTTCGVNWGTFKVLLWGLLLESVGILGTTWGYFGDYVGITCGLHGATWDCSGTTLGLLLYYFGTTWGLGTNFGLSRDYLETS